jgi:hypothetical protein
MPFAATSTNPQLLNLSVCVCVCVCVCVRERERERENEVLCEAAELNLELSENKFFWLVHGDDYGINLHIIFT